SQPRRALFVRPHRCRRGLWPPRHHHQSLPGSRNRAPRAGLACLYAAVALAPRSFLLRPKVLAESRQQQHFRRDHVCVAFRLAFPFRPQETRLAATAGKVRLAGFTPPTSTRKLKTAWLRARTSAITA